MTTADGPRAVEVHDDGETVDVRAAAYRWRWSRATDEFVVTDHRGRRVASAPLQPVVEVVDGAGAECTSPGHVARVRLDAGEYRAYGERGWAQHERGKSAGTADFIAFASKVGRASPSLISNTPAS